MTQEEIIHDILKGMEGIGCIPSNQEFYAEFDFRLRSALGIEPGNERLKAERDTYARIQIEKDRERIKYLLNEHLSTHVSGNTPCCLNSINETPIILDL